MKKNLLIILVLASFLSNCEKSSYPVNFDINYPTIIRKIDAEQLTRLRSDYSERNSYLFSSLNQFGYCAPPEEYKEPESMSSGSVSSPYEAISVAKRFIAKNSQFTGIADTNDLHFIQVRETSGNQDGLNRWHLHSELQKFDSIEVLSTQIIITIRGKEVYSCVGNWYPEIYIPDEIKVSLGKAKEILLNTTATHYNIAGQPYYVKVSGESLSKSTSKLMVVPIVTADQTELRLCWEVNIPSPVFFIMYIDVMTGRIIKQEPTIIS